MVNHLLETSHLLSSSALLFRVSAVNPSSILRTHFQAPCPLSPLLATLMRLLHPGRFYGTKTAGVYTNNAQNGTRFLTNQEIGFPAPHPIKSPHCPHPAGKWTGQTRNQYE
jgi:hypothetical protein